MDWTAIVIAGIGALGVLGAALWGGGAIQRRRHNGRSRPLSTGEFHVWTASEERLRTERQKVNDDRLGAMHRDVRCLGEKFADVDKRLAVVEDRGRPRAAGGTG